MSSIIVIVQLQKITFFTLYTTASRIYFTQMTLKRAFIGHFVKKQNKDGLQI